jgi:4-amino-4-deoxy-L-arabinose transferase-like glycosyltransferase
MIRTDAADLGARTVARLDDMRIAAALLALLAVFLFFHDLGGAALFDPDEGRNAEIAREILETGDWITPYYDFLPRLEKPMFFYAAIALSYKLFGVSEASARFPSAVAALGILLLIFFFVRRLYGDRAALWSGLVLATSVQFNTFSRIVILDMTLVFFITLALVAYYRASVAEDRAERRRYYFLMYAAAAAATLVKGPIGFVVPGMVVLAYIAARKKWASLAEMELGWGVVIFLLIVSPWYVAAEIRRPGYLAYFIGQEHFARYLTPNFHRTKPWHYYLGIVAIGSLPWTFIVPAIAGRLWKKRDDLSLFAVLWIVVPFVFFSLSSSKMSEYLLPIYPALAILAGPTIASATESGRLRLFSVAWLLLAAAYLSLFFVLTMPAMLQTQASEILRELPQGTAVLALIAAILFAATAWLGFTQPTKALFPLCALALALVFLIAHRVVEPFSLQRSQKALGIQAAALQRPGNAAIPFVIYNTYLPGLPFYLRIQKPMWVVYHPSGDDILGSFYLSARKPAPAPGYATRLLTHEEFEREWERRKLLVFVKNKRLWELPGAKVVLRSEDVALVTNDKD